MTQIYCNNGKCDYSRILSEPKRFYPTPSYTPLYDKAVLFECSLKKTMVIPEILKTDVVWYSISECMKKDGNLHGGINCGNEKCMYNHNNKCERSEILVDDLKGKWICTCFAVKGISGHRDFSRFPIGGHMSDGDAIKEDHNNKVAKSFPTHFRPEKVVKPKWQKPKPTGKYRVE